ncbi:MAG: GTPase ObgE [Bacteroidia bacterium]|nr:GTPase ObgE [Bacteroidia bacterium]
MPPHPFVDHVRIYFRSGSGGPGSISWRREKHVPQGGPDGGDGGKGGDIVLEGDSNLWTLLDLKYRKHIAADNGNPGGSRLKTGKSGKDEIIKVPLGTVAMDDETGEMLGEIKNQGERIVILHGGQGGLGNFHFKKSTNQTPEYAQPGIEGEERVVVLELKVLADVGLVGFPNAGKSTLLSVVTAAKPKIGDYPFTTLVPNLGIVKYRDYKSFVMADIPGIIEGASEGKGLGVRFLRHIERNSVLLFLIPADSPNPKKEFKTLLGELEAYDPELIEKNRLLSISKSDLLDEKRKKEIIRDFKGENLIFFSAVAHQGLDVLKDKIWEMLNVEESEEEWWEK